jgi:hypothetical protein
MSEPVAERKRPTVTDRALAEQQARKEREAAALRENLRKRKEQARARAETSDAHGKAGEGSTHPLPSRA